ncbi:MAG: diguanylate cyclase [Planctomycetaceae bacterium]
MSIVDVSQLHEASYRHGDEVRDTAWRFKMAMEAANIGTWEHDVLTDEMEWSQQARAIFGLPLNCRVCAEVLIESVHPEDRERVDAAVKAAMDPAGTERFTVEHRILWRDGTVKWVIGKGQAFFAGEGAGRHVVRMVGIVLDVTEQKRAEHELQQLNATLENRVAERAATLEQRAFELARIERQHREQAEVLRAILDSVAVGIVVSNSCGEITMCNPAAEKFWGHGVIPSAREDWAADYGLFLPDGVTPFPPDEVPLARGLRGESLDGVEVVLRNASYPAGVITSSSARPIRGPNGEIEGAVVTFQDNSELKRAMAEIQELSVTDQLTGLSNRRRLNDVLTAEMSRIQRHRGYLSIVMADLDNFKSVNDKFGHIAGDRVLQSFAKVLRKQIRRSDLAARFGGEEFAIVLPQSDAEGAVICVERVRRQLEAVPIGPDSQPITCSFGVAQLQPGESMDSLLSRADSALYQAKAAGRNQVVVADGVMAELRPA